MSQLDRTILAVAALAATAYAGSISSARADTDHEKELEGRIKYLEERLQRVEQLLSGGAASTVSTKGPAKRKQAVSDKQVKPQQRQQLAVTSKSPDEHETSPPPPSETNMTIEQSADVSPPPTNEKDNTPQELNVLRDNAVTLKPAGIEISNETDYIERQSNLQRDRSIISITTLRYGVLNWLEVSGSLPVGYSTRTSDTSPNTAVRRSISGIGDLSLQTNLRVHEQTPSTPGIVVSIGFVAPTGKSPYDFAHYRQMQLPGGAAVVPNPRDPLSNFFSQGAWSIHSNLQFYKTVDPIILFFGLGLDHVFPASGGVYTVDAFNRFNYNFGFSFALSEKTTLGFSINGSYSPDLKVNGLEVFQTAKEPTLARLSVIQRLFKGVYLEPSMAFGLDLDSPDFVIGLGARARF